VNEDVFQQLLDSIREGGAILRGEAQPARAFAAGDPDVVELRESYGLSQAQFATLMGISVRTLQNWEQQRRKPEGPARVLLRVAAHHPDAIFAVVREEQKRDHATTTRGKKAATSTAVLRRSKSTASYSKRGPTK
jgi:putative transcriptional regulator